MSIIKYRDDKIYCEILDKYIKIKENAIMDQQMEWICDCGNWTKSRPDKHKIYVKQIIDMEEKE